jgi:hypothetical protein
VNKYQAFFGSQSAVIEAATSYEAHGKAVQHFAKVARVTRRNQHMVSVVLLELASNPGAPVIHAPQHVAP